MTVISKNRRADEKKETRPRMAKRGEDGKESLGSFLDPGQHRRGGRVGSSVSPDRRDGWKFVPGGDMYSQLLLQVAAGCL